MKFTFKMIKVAFTLSHCLTQNSHTFFTEFLHFPLSRYVAFTLPHFQTLTRTLTHRWIPFISTFQQASASFPRWNQVLRVLIRSLFLWGMGGWQQPGSGRDIRPSRLRRSLPGMLTCLRFIFTGHSWTLFCNNTLTLELTKKTKPWVLQKICWVLES